MRMAFALGPDDVEGVNVIPGGQSGILESDHYDDQLALWLANETLPLPITVDEVVDAAVTRVTFYP
jgi:penicillin amidase